MDKNFAIQQIKEVFENPFDKGRFIGFIKNLFNHIEEKSFVYRGNYIPDAYKPYIQTLERIGKYEDVDDNKIDILIVQLKKETSLERARTMQRNFIAWYLNGSRGDILKDAALVAFVSPDSEDWRFSLVKMDYKIDTSGERVRVKQELTPARRFSFLVGENENSHTAQSRLAPILQDDSNDPTLKELEEAFSVEKVTKEFFERYRDLFWGLKEGLDEIIKKDSAIKKDFVQKKVDSVDFAKKLLGQIVFLYFLQKKGWFGVGRNENWGTGPKDFLRQLFEKKHADYKNFFNDVLEPLFYEVLRLERPKDYYAQFKCRIPFLNGGLFDPLNDYDWQDTDIELLNELFSNNEKTKQGDIGTGILDVFDRYNFTVKEDEPLEKEVAVDPEMLGKVFENLLEVKDRKSRGTYYTPREVVHYMCRESLTYYLVTELEGKVSKEDIETMIKYGEAVIEYESRVVNEGRETDRYSFSLSENIRKHAKLIDEKLKSIRVCDPAVGSGAFPVGMMKEIIRTRNVLTPYIGKDGERNPYNFKRHAIQNCLYGVDIDQGAVEIAKLRLWLSLVVDEEDRKTIQPLPNLNYKIVHGDSLLSIEKTLFNQELFNRLEKLKPLYFNETSVSRKQAYKEQIDELISKITNGLKDFDYEVYFSEVFHEKGGFDVMIANPPYGANIDEILPVLRPLYQDAIKNYADVYKMFIQLGLRKLRNNGIQAFITPNTFLAQPRYKDIRSVILQFRILKIVNLGEEVFENIIVPTALSFIVRSQPCNTYLFADMSEGSKFAGSLDNVAFQEILLQQVFAAKDMSLFWGRSLRENEVLFSDTLEIRDAGIQYHRSGIGLKNKGGNDLYERLFNSNPKQFNNSIPVWYGRLIDKWRIASQTDEYFNLDYRDILKSNESVSFTREVFTMSPKILWRQTASCLRATLDTSSRWFRNTIQCAFIKEDYKSKLDIYYILGVVNSHYIEREYNVLVKEAGRVFPQVKLTHVKKLPLVIASKAEQIKISNLVRQILVITHENDYMNNPRKQDKVHEYEKQIDQLVYKLYGLKKEEIKTVELNEKQ
ncbi:N-6 DNA methylase [Patescibacteria group bacterium]|nr:N-6 DNA methylase [Patescibacteria group bacterium]